MQIVIESLALAAFGDMLRRTEEPLLTKLLRYVMSDEARHVAFGVLTLSEFYRDLSEAELKERQEFLVDATLNSRARATTPEVWERMGTTAEEVFPFIVQAAEKTKLNPMRGFARGFFAKLVPNVRKLGLLDANNGYLRERWGEAGLLEFEFADDTGSDYASYDAVAQDRAAAGGGRGVREGERRRRAPRLQRVRAICLALPEAEERPFGGHTAPAFRVRDKLFVMTSEDGTSMTMKAPRGAQQVLVASEPERFFVPEVRRAQGLGRRAARSPGRARLGRDGRDDRRELLRFFGPSRRAQRWVGAPGPPGAPDWDEMAEMIAESYCLTAPKRLAALVGPPP